MGEEHGRQTPRRQRVIQWIPVALLALCLVIVSGTVIYLPEVQDIETFMLISIGMMVVVIVLSGAAIQINERYVEGGA